MKVGVRNSYPARVTAIESDAVDAVVALRSERGLALTAVITAASVRRLQLAEGCRVTALIKASNVLIAVGERPRTSTRNRLPGRVATVREGAVNGEATLGLTGGESITASVTNSSIRALGLTPGLPAWALVKATHVLLAVD